MKKIIFLLSCSLFTLWLNSQSLSFKIIGNGSFKNDTLHVNESAGFIFIVVENRPKTPLDILIDSENESASNDDYYLMKVPGKLSLSSANKFMDVIRIEIKEDKYDEKTETFKLKFTYAINGAFIDTTLIVQINPKTNDEKAEKKNKPVQITYLNAFNFDFSNTTTQSNYIGHLNILSGNTSKKWGVNTGIMKINYSQNSTDVNEIITVENVVISPFEPLTQNSKYLKQVNSYKTTRKNTVWSLYVQPLYRISDENNDNEVFAHGHLELLPSSWNSKTTVTNIKQDTAIFMPGTPAITAKTILTNTSSYTISGVYGYFGLGMTFNLPIWENGKFFFQPTVGITSNYPQPSSVDINSNVFPFQEKRSVDQWSSFYLIRANYNHKIGESSILVVGVDVRGLFPKYSPLYAVYAGLDLSINKLVTLITGEKK